MQAFIVGNTYSTRSIGDYNCIFAITIAKRTAKTITTTEGKNLRVFEYDGAEAVMPLGRYSMAPCIKAKAAA